MKNSILFLFCVSMFLLISCNKENADFDKPFDEIELRDGDLMERNGCFDLVYPIEIEMPDGTIAEIENEEDFGTKIKAWYESNPDSKDRPALVYPVQLTFEGDKSKIVSSSEQMQRVKKYCEEKKGKERMDCFKILYPVNYIMPDGSEISGDNGQDVRNLIKEWYAANPDTDLKPELSYPIDVKVSGHGIISIENEDAMIALKKKCAQKDTRECFKLDFPVSFSMPDGSELTVNSDDEMNSSLKEWYAQNPSSDKKPSLIYPVDIIFEDGKSYTINNEKEMIEVKRKCDAK